MNCLPRVLKVQSLVNEVQSFINCEFPSLQTLRLCNSITLLLSLLTLTELCHGNVNTCFWADRGYDWSGRCSCTASTQGPAYWEQHISRAAAALASSVCVHNTIAPPQSARVKDTHAQGPFLPYAQELQWSRSLALTFLVVLLPFYKALVMHKKKKNMRSRNIYIWDIST